MVFRACQRELADAALAVLVTKGSRGLTHRAVDRLAGVTEGSTSYYFRTRQALLAAAVERLARKDTEAIVLSAESRKALIETLAATVVGPGGSVPSQQIARLELSLEGLRHPHLQKTLTNLGSDVHQTLTGALERLRVPDASDRATALMVTVDGLLVNQLMGDESRVKTTENVGRLLKETLEATTEAGP